MISALEHYRDTAEVIEGFWKVKSEYKKCLRLLKYHQLAFEENLEELLLALIADEKKLRVLLKDPGTSMRLVLKVGTICCWNAEPFHIRGTRMEGGRTREDLAGPDAEDLFIILGYGRNDVGDDSEPQ